MKFGKIALAASAAGLTVAPIASHAIAAERTVAPVEGEAELGGKASTGLIVLFVLAAVAIGIFVSDSDGPVSP